MKALIFDLDGTLARPEEPHRRAPDKAFAAPGLPRPWNMDGCRPLPAATGGKERIVHLLKDRGLDGGTVHIAALHAHKTTRCAALRAASKIAPRPGVQALTEAAAAHDCKRAVATRTSPTDVEALARALFHKPAETVFDAVSTSDEMAPRKPAPDVCRLVLQRLGIAAPDVLAFRGSLNGLCSAQAAGLVACVLAAGHFTGDGDPPGADLRVTDRAQARLADLGSLRRAS